MTKRIKFFLATCLLLPCLLSCKPSLPSDILSEGQMEDILYDYHLSQGAVEAERLSSKDAYAYRLAVLRKHGVSQAQFDSSMVYYTRHTELLKKVYENLFDRYNKDAVSLGATASDLNKFGEQTEKGDTADIWMNGRGLVIPAIQPLNYTSFAVDADSAFHKGDRFLLEFDAHFLMQDGTRNGVAVLAIRFANDSVTSKYLRMQTSRHYSLMVEDKDSLGIKKVSGYFMFNIPPAKENSKTTLKLMELRDIRLIKMHVRDRKPIVKPSHEKVLTPVNDTTKAGNIPANDTTKAIKTPLKNKPSTQPPLTAPAARKTLPVSSQRMVPKE